MTPIPAPTWSDFRREFPAIVAGSAAAAIAWLGSRLADLATGSGGGSVGFLVALGVASAPAGYVLFARAHGSNSVLTGAAAAAVTVAVASAVSLAFTAKSSDERPVIFGWFVQALIIALVGFAVGHFTGVAAHRQRTRGARDTKGL